MCNWRAEFIPRLVPSQRSPIPLFSWPTRCTPPLHMGTSSLSTLCSLLGFPIGSELTISSLVIFLIGFIWLGHRPFRSLVCSVPSLHLWWHLGGVRPRQQTTLIWWTRTYEGPYRVDWPHWASPIQPHPCPTKGCQQTHHPVARSRIREVWWMYPHLTNLHSPTLQCDFTPPLSGLISPNLRLGPLFRQLFIYCSGYLGKCPYLRHWGWRLLRVQLWVKLD